MCLFVTLKHSNKLDWACSYATPQSKIHACMRVLIYSHVHEITESAPWLRPTYVWKVNRSATVLPFVLRSEDDVILTFSLCHRDCYVNQCLCWVRYDNLQSFYAKWKKIKLGRCLCFQNPYFVYCDIRTNQNEWIIKCDRYPPIKCFVCNRLPARTEWRQLE